MPLDRHDVMQLLAQLAEEEEIRVTVKGSAFGSLVAGLGAFLGGVTLGPPGLLIGETRRRAARGGLQFRVQTQGAPDSAAFLTQTDMWCPHITRSD